MKLTSIAFGLLVAAIAPFAFGDDAAPKAAATLTVEAGKYDRVDVPLSVELPKELAAKLAAGAGLIETTNGQRVAQPAGVAKSADAQPSALSFILAGKTAAGAVRTFELVSPPPAQSRIDRVHLTRNDERADLSFQSQAVLRYNHIAVKPPAGVDDIFLRSGYIHPIYTPSGKLMTEDFPSDHYHHKGLWWAWVSTEYNGRKLDFWNLNKKTATVKFVKYESVQGTDVEMAFQVKHAHVDTTQQPAITVLDETWDVRVWAVGGKKEGYYLFDLTSTQRCATDKPLHLKKERYGGLGYRGPKDWGKKDYEILTSAGRTFENAHATTARWCIHSGKVGGEDASIVFLSHPSNFRHPEPMRTSGGFGPFFNWAPPQAGDFTMEPGKDYVWRYRFLVADGKVEKDAAERAWRAFAEPPKVTIKPAG